MKFSIITPTYKRPKELIRAVQSVLDQNYPDFEMIIVNDSPDFDYSEFENKELIKDSRVKYFKNKENKGVNFSRNFALEKIDIDSDYILYLDDDDWLAEKSLTQIKKILEEEKVDWLITNRSIKNKSIVRIKKIKKNYNYFFDILIFKNIKGDTTHAIKTSLALKQKFSNVVKNGEEWIYFLKIKTPVKYVDINTTETNGYLEVGLTNLLKDKYNENTRLLWREVTNIKILAIMIYRSIKALF